VGDRELKGPTQLLESAQPGLTLTIACLGSSVTQELRRALFVCFLQGAEFVLVAIAESNPTSTSPRRHHDVLAEGRATEESCLSAAARELGLSAR